MDDETVGALILGAGASSRFGAPKAAIRIGSRTLLQVAIDAAAGAGLAPVIAVLPPGLSEPPSVTVVRNDAPERGMSRSLQLGLRALPPACGAAVVLFVDQPTIDVALVRRLVGARGRTPVVATRSDGRLGPPVLLEREAYSFVEDLRGDIGLRDVLRSRPELVTPVDVEVPLPDVDTPGDLAHITEACPGCAARYLPHAVDEAHPYIGASPACWAAFGELLAREFESPAHGRVHRHTVDVYAVQHPGTGGRRQRQSVALHLIALCHWLEHGLDTPRINALTQALAAADRDWPWLEPPPGYALTVVDLLAAADGDEHARLVRRWAELTWNAWSPHLAIVREWADEALR